MCPYEEKLTAWILGDLSPEERQMMASHLDACAACRNALGELSAVLTPLRSGLAKDRFLQAGAQPVPRPTVRSPLRLWVTRQEWLRRAALFAASFGTLFAVISALYRQAAEDRRDDSPVTHITFQRREPPAPALAPATAAPRDSKPDLSEFHPDAIHSPPPAPIVSSPAFPAPGPNTPRLRQLTVTRKSAAAADAAPVAAPAAAAASTTEKQAAKAVARRERAKAVPSTVTRPPANLQMKAEGFAASAAHVRVTAPTNTAPTNTVPAPPLPRSGTTP